jgi:drug/metabolite transporter (DMT)-like permease
VNHPSRAVVWIALAAVLVSFSINSLITRYLVSFRLVGTFDLTIIRFVSGFVMLQVLSTFFPGRLQKAPMSRRDLLGAAFLGTYAFAISYGYDFISAAAGTFVFYSAVVLTMSMYSPAVEKDRLSVRTVLGQIFGILGIISITLSGIESVTLQGVVLMFVTGGSWGLYSVYGRRFPNYFGYTYSSFMIFAAFALAATLLTFPLAMGSWTEISAGSFAISLYLGIISTALSYILWNRFLKELKASQGGLVQLLVPVLTSFFGVALLSEKVAPGLVLGGALILFAMYVNGTRRTRLYTKINGSR